MHFVLNLHNFSKYLCFLICLPSVLIGLSLGKLSLTESRSHPRSGEHWWKRYRHEEGNVVSTAHSWCSDTFPFYQCSFCQSLDILILYNLQDLNVIFLQQAYYLPVFVLVFCIGKGGGFPNIPW